VSGVSVMEGRADCESRLRESGGQRKIGKIETKT
jgi:hypothetical protein